MTTYQLPEPSYKRGSGDIPAYHAEQMQAAYQAGRESMREEMEKGIRATQAAAALAGSLEGLGAGRKLRKHDFWGAGEPDCPADIKGSNGELHTMRCKNCGDGWRDANICKEIKT